MFLFFVSECVCVCVCVCVCECVCGRVHVPRAWKNVQNKN